MKRKINKGEYDALTDAQKTLYKKSGDNYVIDIEGDDEAVTAAKQALENERTARKAAEDKIKEADKKATEAADEAARKSGDVTALEKSWQKKYDDKVAELQGTIDKGTKDIEGVTLESQADAIAREISTAPSLLRGAIRGRLTLDRSGDAPIVRVLDANGKPSASSVDDLKKELRGNKEYASIIIAGKGSGGGAPANHGGGGAEPRKAPNGSDGKPADLSKLSPKDLAAHIAATKAEQGETST